MSLEQARQLGAEAAHNQLKAYPNRWIEPTISYAKAKDYVRRHKVPLDSANREAELNAFIEGYNVVGKEYRQVVDRQAMSLANVRVAGAFAEENGFNPDNFRNMCRNGMVPGAILKDSVWLLTEEAGHIAIETQKLRPRKIIADDEKAAKAEQEQE